MTTPSTLIGIPIERPCVSQHPIFTRQLLVRCRLPTQSVRSEVGGFFAFVAADPSTLAPWSRSRSGALPPGWHKRQLANGQAYYLSDDEPGVVKWSLPETKSSSAMAPSVDDREIRNAGHRRILEPGERYGSSQQAARCHTLSARWSADMYYVVHVRYMNRMVVLLYRC